MKYNHIIYNSSQTNREGRPGFGERAVTIGTDPALLAALADSSLYTFDYSHPRLSTTSLASDPTLIRLIEPSYFYTVVEYGNKKAWLLGRKIAVGFDYMFYANGNPTRLGNYVADIYAFDSVPDRAAFEALYENPAPGSMHFIPTSPEPRADNVEMRAISLERPQDMSPEEKPFKAALLPAIDPRAVKLLFAFYAHLTNGKPVAAVIADKDAGTVIASFMRIVPEELISRATFVTNYNETGVPKGFAIACVDPENAAEFMPMVWNVVNLTEEDAYASVESSQLAPEFTEALAQGNMLRLLNLSRWLFSSEYKGVKELDEAGREIAFRYVIEPSSITPEILNRTLNSEAGVQALVKLINAGGDTKIIDKYLDSVLAEAESVNDILTLMNSALALDNKGLHCAKDSLTRARCRINSIVLASPESFVEFFNKAGGGGVSVFNPYAEFLELDSLKNKRNNFLSTFKPAVWKRLYSLFFPTPVDEKALVRRTVTDRLPENERSSFLFETIAPERLIVVVKDVMLEKDEYCEALLPVLCQLQDHGISPRGERYFDIFASKRNEPKFAEMMIKEYAKSVPLSPVDKEVERMEQLAKYPSLVRAITDVKLAGVHKSLKAAALADEKNPVKNVAPLCDRVSKLPVNSKVIADVKFLADVIRGNYSADAQKVANLGMEIGNLKAVKEQLPALAAVKLDSKTIADLVNFLNKKGVPRTDVLAVVLAAPKDSLRHWLSSLFKDEKKQRVLTIITELQNCGLSSEKAVAVLEETLPDDHKAYLKSLRPNVFVRFGRWVKGLFSKKAKTEEDETPKPAETAAPKHAPKAEKVVKGKPQPKVKTVAEPTPQPKVETVAEPAPEQKVETVSETKPDAISPTDSVNRDHKEVPAAAPDPDEMIEREGDIDLS